jgi:hypothetical protein
MDARAAQGIGLATGKKGSRAGAKVSLFEFLRDVLIASMNKGQFPAALIAMIVLSMIWRMPPADVSKLVFRLFDVAQEKSLVGYVAAVIFLFGWLFHTRYQRRLITREMQRISNERNQLQARELGKRIKSSEVGRK